MTKKLDFRWKLREIMASRGLFSTADIHTCLVERGIELSKEQVWRLVTQKPVRIQVETLLALCDALDCRMDDLFEAYSVNEQVRRKRKVNQETKELRSQIEPPPFRVVRPGESRK